ncbi:MAG TPA: Ig-like domain repeat protein, partial [Candidatus Sumerlaeota bacterium]|nr:Ig-like domain repeat protein [Candidatus Sumerlaeota bacterium]
MPDTPADWLVTSDTLQAGIGVGHPGHNSASLDLSQVNWSLDPARRQNWSLNKAKRNEWGGWMDLNRPAVSGWLEGRYSCAYVLACDQADFTTSTARGYAIGFKAGGSSPLVLFRFDAGINSGALQLPANTTEIVQSGYNYLDSDNGVNFYVQLQADGHWAVRWKSGAALSPEAVFDVDATSYTAPVISTGTDTTYQGYEFKYAGWVYAHSVSSLAYAYFGHPGAGESPYDFSAPSAGTVEAPTYAKAPFAVSWSGVTDSLSGVASVEVWAKKDSQVTWALVGAGPSGSGLAPFSPANGDGTYGFTLVTVDRDGNRSADPTSVTVPADTTVYDTVQPVAGPVTATPYSSTSLTVSYSGTTDTLSGLASAQLWYSYDNTNSWTALSGMTTSTSAASFDLNASIPGFTLSDGVYHWGFVVTDKAGNTTSTASGTGAAVSYFDTTPPTAGSVMAPQYMTGGPIPVAFGGFLDGVSGLREVQLGYRLAGAPTWVYDAVYTTTTATGTFQFDPVLGNGVYEFQARAWDNAGNTVVSGSTAQTIVDNEPPMGGTMSVGTLYHPAPIPIHFTNATPIPVSYSGTTDTLSGLKAVHLLYQYYSPVGPGPTGLQDTGLITTTTAGTFSFVPPVDPYSLTSDGAYLFLLMVVDNAGNEAMTGAPAYVLLDTVNPDAGTLVSPAYEKGTSVTLAYSGVTDEMFGVSTVTLYANSWSNPIDTKIYGHLDDLDLSGAFTYTPPSDGTYVFGLRVWDLSGNMSESVTSSTTVYDTTAPTTAGLSVATVTSGTVIPVTCTAYPQDLTSGVERVELWYRVNGTTWTATSQTFATTGTVVNFAPPSGINGVYEFGTVVTDRAGNQTVIPPEAATTTTYDNQAPAVGTVTTPAYTNASLISVAYSGFADAGLGLADVRLWVRVGSSGTWTASPTEFGATSSGTFSYTATTNDTYYFAVVARDLLSNSTPL